MAKISFSQAVTGYQLDANARHLSQHTLADYQNAYRKFQFFLQGDPPIAEIRSTHARDFLAAQVVSNKTILNYHIALSALWTWAVQTDLVAANILHQVPRPKPEKRAIVELKKEEVERILVAVSHSRVFTRPGQRACNVTLGNADRNRAIILLLLDTGIRVTELCELTINRCDLKTRRIIVFGKGNKEREIPISARTGQVIWKYLTSRKDASANDLLFVTREGLPMTRKNVLDTLSEIGDRAGVENVHPHRFRHTFAVNYLRNGGDVFTLQDILGHSSLDMVQVYLHIAHTDVESGHRKASPVDNWRL